MSALAARIGAWLPRGWGDLFRQLALYLLANFSYEVARGLAEGRAEIAFANGERVMDVERSMKLFIEPTIQAGTVTITWLVDIANFIYLNSQFTVALGFLIWMYLFRNEQYYFFRNMFFASMAIALIGYIGFPTAPPRMYPEYGFLDTVNAHSPVNHEATLAQLFINPFAAVPSMHCAVSMIIGGTGFKATRNWFARTFWLLWPAVVTWVTVVTANHYWLDAVLGWGVAIASFLIARYVAARIKPDLWTWTDPAPRRPAGNGKA